MDFLSKETVPPVVDRSNGMHSAGTPAVSFRHKLLGRALHEDFVRKEHANIASPQHGSK